MPVRRSKDRQGTFYAWGNQKRYYYKPGNERSRRKAKSRAIKQGIAITYSMWGGKPPRDIIGRM